MSEIVTDNVISVLLYSLFLMYPYVFVCVYVCTHTDVSLADSNCLVKICCLILNVVECVLLRKIPT